MKVTIEVIEHSQQRYATVGDWQWNDNFDELTVKVSRIKAFYDHDTILLIGIHEVIEALLCRRSFIPEWQVDQFDLAHAQCANPEYAEQGDDPKAPYHIQHVFASNIERQIAFFMGFNWQQYEREIEELD